jgi:hypothetical protein
VYWATHRKALAKRKPRGRRSRGPRNGPGAATFFSEDEAKGVLSMRHLFVATLFAISLLAAGLSASPAAAQARYCLQGRHWGYPGNCQFATYGQCMATASGTAAFCGVNPRYAFARQRRGSQRHQ